MIPQQVSIPEQESKETFITNFYNTADQILNILVEEGLQKVFDGKIPPSVKINKEITGDHTAVIKHGDTQIVGIYQNFNNSKWILYANEGN